MRASAAVASGKRVASRGVDSLVMIAVVPWMLSAAPMS